MVARRRVRERTRARFGRWRRVTMMRPAPPVSPSLRVAVPSGLAHFRLRAGPRLSRTCRGGACCASRCGECRGQQRGRQRAVATVAHLNPRAPRSPDSTGRLVTRALSATKAMAAALLLAVETWVETAARRAISLHDETMPRIRSSLARMSAIVPAFTDGPRWSARVASLGRGETVDRAKSRSRSRRAFVARNPSLERGLGAL